MSKRKIKATVICQKMIAADIFDLKLSAKEIACHAYNLYAAFEWSKANKKTASIIKSLCENLEEDVVNMPNNEDVKIWIKHIQEELNGAEM